MICFNDSKHMCFNNSKHILSHKYYKWSELVNLLMCVFKCAESTDLSQLVSEQVG